MILRYSLNHQRPLFQPVSNTAERPTIVDLSWCRAGSHLLHAAQAELRRRPKNTLVLLLMGCMSKRRVKRFAQQQQPS